MQLEKDFFVETDIEKIVFFNHGKFWTLLLTGVDIWFNNPMFKFSFPFENMYFIWKDADYVEKF